MLLIELAHHALQRVFRHLTVGDRDAGLGDKLKQPLVARLDRVDIVMEEVDLAPALQLSENGFPDQRVAFRPHKGLHGQPPLGRRRDHGEVPHAFKRHRHRAGNRGRGERENVDLGTKRLQFLFLPHAEPVLLINDDEPEVLEFHGV